MSVIRLVGASTKDTVTVLESLLEKARRGQIIGIAICFSLSNGTEEAAFTGRYKADPAKAVNSSLRMSMRLAQMQNEGISL